MRGIRSFDEVAFHGERVCLFVDGPNLYNTAKTIQLDIDFNRLRQFFSGERARLIRSHYYTTIHDLPDDEPQPLKPLLDYLDYNGWTVVTKFLKEYTDRDGQRRFKGRVDIDLAVDMLRAGISVMSVPVAGGEAMPRAMTVGRYMDHAVLFTGDGEYARAVEALQDAGVRVTVVSSIGMVSDDLRRQADVFLDLDDLREMIQRAERRPVVDRSETAGVQRTLRTTRPVMTPAALVRR